MVASGIISLILAVHGSALFYNSLEYAQLYSIVFKISNHRWIIYNCMACLLLMLQNLRKEETLFSFYKKIQPGGPGWKTVLDQAEQKNITLIEDNAPWSVPSGILAIITSLILAYIPPCLQLGIGFMEIIIMRLD